MAKLTQPRATVTDPDTVAEYSRVAEKLGEAADGCSMGPVVYAAVTVLIEAADALGMTREDLDKLVESAWRAHKGWVQ